MRGLYFIFGRWLFEIKQNETLTYQNLQSGVPNEAPFNNHSWLRSEDFPGWLLALFSAPVTNWESLQTLPSALQLSARDKDSRAPTPLSASAPCCRHLPQKHQAELLQQVCACPHGIRELTSNPWLNMGWEGMFWVLLSSWYKTNFNRTDFLCNTKPWGLGGKINILNCFWKPTSTKEKLALRHVVALSNL